MSQFGDGKFSARHGRRSRPSLFGPIVLIGLGSLFLLNNLGLLSRESLNWFALLQLWPLWLIFLGVNVIVRQMPGAIGSLFSGLVGFLAVAVIGYVLLFSEDSTLLSRLGTPSSSEVMTETIEYSAADLRSADINLDFSSAGVDLYALNDSASLIEGTVTYTGDLIFEADQLGGKATIHLDTVSGGNDWLFFVNPANWNSIGESERWQIGLDPDVEIELTMDVGSGSAKLDLSELDLSGVTLDGGSGSMEMTLPGGDYDLTHDAGSGSTRMTLPSGGRHTVNIEAGSGSVTLYIPSSVEARVEVDGGSGSFSINEARFDQVSGSDHDEGVWETVNYDDAPDRVNLIIDAGSGSVRIREP